MTVLNQITSGVSIFSIMSALALKHEALNLSQGFPNFKSDTLLINAVSNAMEEGYNQYAPMAGDIGLRHRISEKIKKLHQTHYCPESEITVTAGATQAIFTAIAATISKADEVIVFTPAYDCYAPTIALFGGNVIPIQLKAPLYVPDWDEVTQKITPKTRMIIINTPHNPSGTIFNREDMLRLEQLAEKHNLIVLSDEVYEHIIFDNNIHQSVAKYPALAARSFITASFGKTFHNTGWKIGYCVAPKSLMRKFQKVHQYNVFCVNHPIQKALDNYMEDATTYTSLPAFYQKKRDYFLERLTNSRFKIIPSQGTYFQLLDFSNISNESDVAFAERLTITNGIATIPTSVFNSNKEDFKQIRVCFAKDENTLDQATAILNTL